MSLRQNFSGVAILAAVALGCAHGAQRGAPAQEASLRVDSTQYTVRLVGVMYQATIAYVYTNLTGSTVSANYCRAPAPPLLEKKLENGRWVLAYSQILLMCKTSPPFRIGAGESYRDTLRMAVAKPGANIMPLFEGGFVPGIYRLRWVLCAGADPDDRSAPRVEAISPSFRLVGP